MTPRVVSELFRLLKERTPQYAFTVSVSMFELYKDGLRDLQVHNTPLNTDLCNVQMHVQPLWTS